MSGFAHAEDALLIDGKITLVHRRLWPALVKVAARFPAERLAEVHDEHAPSGRHVHRDVPFPQWVPADITPAARALREQDAIAAFTPWLRDARVSSPGRAPR